MQQQFRSFLYSAASWALLGLGPAQLAADDWTVQGATYAAPTTRYDHAVLGDAVEYGRLDITVQRGASAEKATVQIDLSADRVFEDIMPRLWDVTGDGRPEVVVVESSLTGGAQLAVYDARGWKIAATPHIGMRNRWLAPVAAADLDGDGYIEIAYVDRPHLAKTLRIWRFKDGDLTQIAQAGGVSNHQIGWDYTVGGLRACAEQVPELVLPSGDWRSIVALRLENAQVRHRRVAAYTTAALTRAMLCK